MENRRNGNISKSQTVKKLQCEYKASHSEEELKLISQLMSLTLQNYKISRATEDNYFELLYLSHLRYISFSTIAKLTNALELDPTSLDDGDRRVPPGETELGGKDFIKNCAPATLYIIPTPASSPRVVPLQSISNRTLLVTPSPPASRF
ncbi:hypothetical protein WN51_10526 [Melipona quadrifasciata]|uniref:Uncharacterized protein n=1 Tax=Melipona quadrifasciata TaxID=166423 RepID=A0A0M9A5N4_9HYME|nr:hypothetical protein WN51_10526 [Melipona quadrifasciata]